MRKDLKEIITKQLSIDDIKKYLNEEYIDKAEALVLEATLSDQTFSMLSLGEGKYKLYDIYANTDDYYTNVNLLLIKFYSLYKKFPNYHFDKLLEQMLIIISQNELVPYRYFELLILQLKNEKNGISSFIIEKEDIIKQLNDLKHNYYSHPNMIAFLNQNQMYLAKYNSNGLLGVMMEHNEILKQELGIDLFEGQDLNLNSRHI